MSDLKTLRIERNLDTFAWAWATFVRLGLADHGKVNTDFFIIAHNWMVNQEEIAERTRRKNKGRNKARAKLNNNHKPRKKRYR